MKRSYIVQRVFPPPALSGMNRINGHNRYAGEGDLSDGLPSEAEPLQRAWARLDQAIEEIEDKDRVIRALQTELRRMRRTARKQDTLAINPAHIGMLVSNVEREHVAWLWPGRLALGKLTILDGDPGLGKSTLLYDLAARITTGRAMPDGAPTQPGGVLILSTEDGIGDTIRPRLEAAGADLARCLVVQTIPEADGPGRVPVLPEDLPLLVHAVLRAEARLLIIDPLMAYLGGDTNSYRDQDVRRALAPVSAFAGLCGLAVVVVRHLNKATGGSPLYRGGGSIGIIGAARVGLLVGRDPQCEDRLVLASTKNNLARKPTSLAFRVVSAPGDPETSMIEWEGPCALDASDLLSPPVREAASTAVEEAAWWLTERLAEGPRPAAELYEAAEAAGIKKRVLQRARRRVAETERVGGISGAGYWVWSLPRMKPPELPAKIAKVPMMPVSGNGGVSPHSGHLSEAEQEEVPAKPALRKDQWVRTPQGEGRVLQVFAHQVSVQIADKALLFPPGAVVPIDEAPRP